MSLLRLRHNAAELAAPLLGAAVTVLAAYLSVRMGAEVGVGVVLGCALFVIAVAGFVAYPHIAVAGTILLFSLIPMLKVFVASEMGAVKDVVVAAAVVAAVIVYAFERRPIDRTILILVSLLLFMYVVNVGSGQDAAWAQGLRLVSEPILLLMVGLTLTDPRRTLRYALGALVLTACVVAAYGLFQQVVGKYTLVDWGYSFDSQVRSLYGGQLRSFGTLDDPFTYASTLLLGFIGVLFWLRGGPLAWAAGFLILAGALVSFSRAAALVLIGLAGLALARKGYLVSAVLVVGATVVAGAVLLVNATGTEARTYPGTTAGGSTDAAASANVILNGRISAWEAALGDDPSDWVFGRGVGQVGTAAERSTYTFTSPGDDAGTGQSEAVDSGYLATIADVGLVGLLVLLGLFAKLLTLAAHAARRGLLAGWVAMALLVALLLDALTRAAFTGYPAAYLSLLVVGIALAAAEDEAESPAPKSSPALAG